MAIQFMNLPALEANRLLNFAPVNQAVDKIGNALRYRDETDYNRAKDARQEARANASHGAAMSDRAERRRREQVEMLGKQSLAVQQIQDPARRAMIWGRIVQSHPNAKGLGAEYHDPTTGPELLAAEAGQYVDDFDRKMKEAELGYKQAQTQKLQAAAAGGGSPDYGKTGTIFQGPDGGYYAVRWAADGSQKIVPVGQGMTPARGVSEVDTGTGTAIIDKATGQDVRVVPKDLAGAERAKVIGREIGEGQMQLPKSATGLQQYELQDDVVNRAIDKATEMADGLGATGLPSQLTGSIGGTSAFNLSKQLDTVKGNIGFDKLQNLRDNSPTGGALGQVAVQELQMLQSVLGSLDQAQDAAQLKDQLAQIKQIRAQFRVLKRQAYDRDVSRFGISAVPNPETGKASTSAPPPSGDGFTVEFE